MCYTQASGAADCTVVILVQYYNVTKACQGIYGWDISSSVLSNSALSSDLLSCLVRIADTVLYCTTVHDYNTTIIYHLGQGDIFHGQCISFMVDVRFLDLWHILYSFARGPLANVRSA